MEYIRYYRFTKKALSKVLNRLKLYNPISLMKMQVKPPAWWLINLPPLKHGIRFPGRWVDGKERWSNQTDSGQNKLGPSDDRDELRSKTYPGIARAMAEQWGEYLLEIII